MEFKQRQPEGKPGVVIVEVAGEVDSASAEQFREQLVSLIEGPTKHLIVNLADLTYINSSGLGALVAGYKRVRSLDGTLKLCNVRGSIAEVMKLIRLDKIIDIYDSEEEALASL
ncbi:MAG: anti-sigma factor antagonist [Armatimonadia bacterium]|jgi:anti-anti-sigma factor|nr:anti-sigma factor antagonist [Armatimonadia bacterium]